MRISDWSSDVCSSDLGYDDNGRIVLSPMIKELGELDRLAFFIAAGDTFEIWNPNVLLEVKGASDPRLARIVRAQIEAKGRSEEHTSELQSLMRISYAVFCLKKKKNQKQRQYM